MLFFVTMKRMQGPMPSTEFKEKSPLFFPSEDDRMHFAVFYSAFPSSKGLQYKVYCIHVGPDGKKFPNSPLYGFNCNDPKSFKDSPIKKIAETLHILIAITSELCGIMWYEYESHSPPNEMYCDVFNWASLISKYSRFVPINIDNLATVFKGKYQHSYSVAKENPERPFPFANNANIAKPLERVSADSVKDSLQCSQPKAETKKRVFVSKMASRDPIFKMPAPVVRPPNNDGPNPAKKARRDMNSMASMQPEMIFGGEKSDQKPPDAGCTDSADCSQASIWEDSACGNTDKDWDNFWGMPSSLLDGLDSLDSAV